MTDAIERRLVALERENSDLRARIDALQLLLGNKTAPPRRDEPQVRITNPPLANVAMPNEQQFDRLLETVVQRFPVLRPREDVADFNAQFRAAFKRLTYLGRREKVDTNRALSWWCDDAREWCRRHRVNPSWINGAAFVAAALAHGDIAYTTLDEWPHVSLGLQFTGGGVPAKDWWHRVLAGTLLDPVPSPYPKAAASPARAQQLAMGWHR
jgi:hypothetical protein